MDRFRKLIVTIKYGVKYFGIHLSSIVLFIDLVYMLYSQNLLIELNYYFELLNYCICIDSVHIGYSIRLCRVFIFNEICYLICNTKVHFVCDMKTLLCNDFFFLISSLFPGKSRV